ncbi:MAG TPA: glycosyltransferase family 9 protein [Steroidobacteraceae bacterium]|nr:glycosyltransferase family 9 protein [Steroidobacteraceae bacterium]
MRDPDTSAKPEAVRRIVVLRPNHRIGNTLLLTPLMQALETQFPEARIDLVTAGGVARAVFARYPQVTTLHAFPGKSYRHPVKVLSLLRHLRQQSYDLAIDPTLRSRAGRFLLRFVRARRRLGYAWGEPGKDKVLTDAADPTSAPAHHAEIPVYLLHTAFRPPQDAAVAPTAQRQLMDIRLSEAERREGALELEAVLAGSNGEQRPTLGLFAHATGEKCLPAEWWRQLVDCLQAHAPTIRLVEILPEDALPRLDGMVAGTFTPQLRMLGAKLAATSLVVIADGGIMHLADAAGASVLALFTTTAPSQYGPRRAGSESLLATGIAADAVAAHISARLLGRDVIGGRNLSVTGIAR